jgi:hypothetical protein
VKISAHITRFVLGRLLGVPWDRFLVTFGSLWEPLGGLLAAFGPPWGAFGLHWGSLGRLWDTLGRILGPGELFWGAFGCHWVRFDVILGAWRVFVCVLL